MEGRRIFAELTVDENLRAGAFTRRSRAEVREAYERVVDLFPRLAERRRATAGYLSGGEQQMLAIGRALMAARGCCCSTSRRSASRRGWSRRSATSIAELNRQGTSVLLVEQNAAMALAIASHGYVMETGRVVKDGPAGGAARRPGHPGVLPRRRRDRPALVPRRQVLPARGSDGAAERARAPAPSRCVDVTLRFGGVTALDGVSFDVAPGELFAVIGPNGAGKTSIFNCINGVYRPQEGSIRLAGERADRPLPARRRAARRGAHVPEPRAVHAPVGDRQPDARPPSPDAHGLHHRRGVVGPRQARGDRGPRSGRGGGRAAGARGAPAHAGRAAAVRAPEAAGARPRAGDGAEACCCSTSRSPA